MDDSTLSPRHAPGSYVAGHGAGGLAVWRRLKAEGFTNLVGWRSAEVDLRDRDATFDAVRIRPAVTWSSGRGEGRRDPGQLDLPRGLPQRQPAHPDQRLRGRPRRRRRAAAVPRLLVHLPEARARSRSPSPRCSPGPLEPTNDAYAIAKIAGIIAIKSYRAQYGRRWISAMPTNLYGPGDNFDLDVVPRPAGDDPQVPRGQRSLAGR